MRIISGSARGTKLYTLEGENTRPTLDRIKEPLFSILFNKIQDASVLDLFAGSGALGIESLSRGAKNVIFCDNSKEAINIINKNLEKTRLKEQAQVLNTDFRKCLELLNGEKFDIVFLDPPYKSDYIILSVEKIIKLNLLKEDGLIIAETDREEIIEQIKKIDISVEDIRHYGRAILIFLKRRE